MKNKILKFGFVIVAISLVISSCAPASTAIEEAPAEVVEEEAPKEEAPAEEAKPEAPKEKVVIEYWHGQAETMGGALCEELAKEFNAQNDHIEVKVKFFPDQYAGILQGMQQEGAAGKAPGVIQLGWLYVDYFDENFPYVSPQDVIDAHFPEDATFLTDNYPSNLLALGNNKDGVLEGAPYSLSSSVLFYNADLFEQAGLPLEGPQTWEQVIQYAKQIKDKTGKYGIYVETDNWTFSTIMASNGAKILDDSDGTIKAAFASPEGIEAYQAIADMALKDKSALHITFAEGIQSFVDGNVAMTFATIGQMTNITKNAQFDVRAVNAPIWEGKDRVLHTGGSMLAIPARTEEEQKAAWEFMKFLLSAENVFRWTQTTGYIPGRTDVVDLPEFKEWLTQYPQMNAALTQMEDMRKWYSFPGEAGLQGDRALIDARDEIMTGQRTAAEVLPEVQKLINDLMVAGE